MHECHVHIDGVVRHFGATRAIDGCSLQVQHGEVVAIVGPSGSGKSTLLNLIAGHERPDHGAIAIDGITVANDHEWVPPNRRQVGLVFQDYALFPHLDVAANVAFGVRERRGRTARVQTMLKRVGLAGLEHRFPHELSGGQQQRVAIARSLAAEPDILLLDEPFAHLDACLRESVRRELLAVVRDLNVTCVIVTHDREEALSVADRVAVMVDGRIEQVDRPEIIYAAPANRRVAEYVGRINVVPGTIDGKVVATELGEFRLDQAARNGATEVYVRPELIGVRPDITGNATVIDRAYFGHDVLYTLELTSGRTVWAHRPSVNTARIGDRVHLACEPGTATCMLGGCAQTCETCPIADGHAHGAKASAGAVTTAAPAADAAPLLT